MKNKNPINPLVVRNLDVGTHGSNPDGLVLVLAAPGVAGRCLLWESITVAVGVQPLHTRYRRSCSVKMGDLMKDTKRCDTLPGQNTNKNHNHVVKDIKISIRSEHLWIPAALSPLCLSSDREMTHILF